jgi:hypothetical protein
MECLTQRGYNGKWRLFKRGDDERGGNTIYAYAENLAPKRGADRRSEVVLVVSRSKPNPCGSDNINDRNCDSIG